MSGYKDCNEFSSSIVRIVFVDATVLVIKLDKIVLDCQCFPNFHNLSYIVEIVKNVKTVQKKGGSPQAPVDLASWPQTQ